jgi:hypothetical protein
MNFLFKTATRPKPRRADHSHNARSAYRGPAIELSWPDLARPIASEAGSRGVIPTCTQHAHSTSLFIQGALRARAVARLTMAHRWLISSNVLKGEGPHYSASPGLARS